MRVTKKLIYAIEAVLDIAYNSADDTVQANDIAQRQGIPKRYLEQVLQQMVKANILSGVRGPQGGYRLARERRRIHLAEIYDIIRALDTTQDPINQTGSQLGDAILKPLWHSLYKDMYDQLKTTTIEDLCRQAQIAGIIPSKPNKTDYTI